MPPKLIPPRVFLLLTALAVVFLIAAAVILGVGAILGAMGDATGQAILNGVALGCGILLAVDLICLVLALGLNALSEPPEPPEIE